MGNFSRFDPEALRQLLRQALMESMQYDYFIIEYSAYNDEGQNEYDNPIVKQIMAME